MNQTAPQQNYQQYAPQYDQQMQQQYQVAPSGSQYVTQPPSGIILAPSQQAMTDRFGRGQDGLYRGQRPPNPCICCKWLCRGTCSLRIGCYVVGTLCVLSGLCLGGAEAITDSYMLHLKFHYCQTGLVYSDAVFFNALPGALLLVGAWSLEPGCCIVAAILLVLGGVYGLFWLILIAYFILSHYYSSLHEHPSETTFAALLIVAAIFCLALRLYYAYCASGLVQQIRNGEYKLVPPEPSIIVQQILTSAPSAMYTDGPNGPQMPVQVSSNEGQEMSA